MLDRFVALLFAKGGVILWFEQVLKVITPSFVLTCA